MQINIFRILILSTILALIIVLSFFVVTDFFEESPRKNHIPTVFISNPDDGEIVSKIVTIYGNAHDLDDDITIKKVEVKINDNWELASGTIEWSYEWATYDLLNGFYSVEVRAWDGADYSDIAEVKVKVQNPIIVESDTHKWAVFIVAANFPEENESKLGNGGLYLAEEMAEYFIEKYNFPTTNILILFDDGWIRADNGFGIRISPLSERNYKYNITYAAATKRNVVTVLEDIIEQSNKFDDSEIFIWLASHGCGDSDKKLFGGRFLQSSALFLWDDILIDVELGVLLNNLRSSKTCVIVDACFSGGFADKTIFNLPTFFLTKSKIPSPGRVVITGSSKFRVGYASIEKGPLFSLLWFEGLKTGNADGFKPGILDFGRPSRLNIFLDGKISVEEAFYYARYILKNEQELSEYNKMEPQITDQYPDKGLLGNTKGMIL
jgi:hypothetical protein